MLNHLLSNAVKFTEAGGTVSVGASLEPDGRLLLFVRDTGIGIPEEDIERVFEPFTQLDGTLARRFQGAGLGLYVSRALVAGHGGELSLRSVPGDGDLGGDPPAGRTGDCRCPVANPLECPPTAVEGNAAMTPLAATDKLFFERADAALDRAAAEATLGAALARSDDGELYLEYRESEQISLDDGRIRSAGFDTSLGFGLRAVAGEATGYAHAGELSEPALRRAASSVAAVAAGHSGVAAEPPRATNARLYSDANPLGATEFPARTALLAEIDAYARGKDSRVVQVMASISWRVAGGADHAPRRHAGGRPAAAGAAERRRRGGAGRPARDRQLRHRRPLRLRPRHRAHGLARRGRRGAAPGAGQS